MNRTMRNVTVGTVFADRWVLVEKWSALIFMTAQAGVGEIQADQFSGLNRTMRGMAVSADQLSFKQRVTARQPDLGPHLLMALVAGIRLADPLQHLLARCMGVMTIATGKIFYRMSAAVPMHQIAAMAIKTD